MADADVQKQVAGWGVGFIVSITTALGEVQHAHAFQPPDGAWRVFQVLHLEQYQHAKWVIRVRSSQDVQGEVLALDEASGLLTLKQPGSTPFHSNLRVLRTDQITVSILHVASTQRTASVLPGSAMA